MFLIDTDILSVLRRRERHPNVVAWVSEQRTTDLYLSAVSVAEIERGIIRQENHNPAFARVLAAWLDNLLVLYGDRVLAVDMPTALRWGRLCGAIAQEKCRPAHRGDRTRTRVNRRYTERSAFPSSGCCGRRPVCRRCGQALKAAFGLTAPAKFGPMGQRPRVPRASQA